MATEKEDALEVVKSEMIDTSIETSTAKENGSGNSSTDKSKRSGFKLFNGELTLMERYCRSNVTKPWQHFIGIWLVIGVATAIVMGSGWFNIQNFTVDDWTIARGKGSTHQDAYDSAVDNSDTTKAFESVERPFRTEAISLTSVLFIYEWRDKRTADIFTPENVQAICEFERTVLLHPEFPLFCQTQLANGSNTICDNSQQPLLTPLFYPTLDDQADCELLTESNVSDVRSFLIDIEFLFFFDRAVSNDLNANSPKTRSTVILAGPLGSDSTGGPSFSKVLDIDSDPQWPYYKDFSFHLQDDLDAAAGVEHKLLRSGYFNKIYIGEDKQIRLRYYAWAFDLREINVLIVTDTALLVLSIIFVGLCTFHHVKSGFMTVVGLTAVMSGIPFGLFLYTGILQVHYFSQVHVTVLFLIVGIGSDNVFVFSDAWHQSAHLWYEIRGLKSFQEAADVNLFKTGNGKTEVLIYRLTYCVERSSSGIFNTMLTTVVAFLATAVSPVIPVAAFGLFAAMVVFSNYLWVFLVYPSMVILREMYFADKPCCPCTSMCHKGGVVDKETQEEDSKESKGLQREESEREIQEKMEELEEENDTALEARFFTRLYIPFMTRKTGPEKSTLKPNVLIAVAALVINFALFVGFAIQALKLEVPNKVEGNYKEGHMFSGIEELNAQGFAGGAEQDFATIILTFGISGMDRSGFKNFEPNGYRGVAVFDENFDLAPSASQLYYLSWCQDLRNLTCIPEGKTEPLLGCTDKLTGKLVFSDHVICPLEQFYPYEQALHGLDQQQVLDLGDNNPALFYEHFENFSLSIDNSDYMGFYDHELKFISIEFLATLKNNRPTREKEPVFKLLYKFEDEKTEQAPPGIKSSFYSNFDMVFIDTEKGIVSGLFQGLAVSLPAAYGVLLVGTDNFILATFAFFSIVGIVCCVLGTVYTLGWTLGIAEAIAAIMVVGLSVDYSVHIGHMYAVAGEEGHETRAERFEVAAKRMGPTVLAGFVTTAGSASMMFFCQLAFFPKMATLIALTVAFSFEFALGFYLPICLLAGPKGETGKISRIIASVRKFFTCKTVKESKEKEFSV